MGTERRLENKRTRITKRMELSCLDTGRHFIGETADVSDSGIRACLNRSPQPGSSVLVKLFWDEQKKPVETFGRVAWTSPVPAGDGIEVGLMLGADSDVYGVKPEKKRATTRYHRYRPSSVSDVTGNPTRVHHYPPMEGNWSNSDSDAIETGNTVASIATSVRSRIVPVLSTIELSKGESFEVTYQGKRTWAKINAADIIDVDGQMRITLDIKDRKLWQKKPPVDIADDAYNPDEWRPRPVYHAQQKARNLVGSLTRGISSTLRNTFTQISAGTRTASEQLPSRSHRTESQTETGTRRSGQLSSKKNRCRPNRRTQTTLRR
jgi:hypothetical protein